MAQCASTAIYLGGEISMTQRKEMKDCDGCGVEISENYGTCVCVKCGEKKCVENCIPGGRGTQCVDCDLLDG